MSQKSRLSLRLVHACAVGLLVFLPGRLAADESLGRQSLRLEYLDTRLVDLFFYAEVRPGFDPERFNGYVLSQMAKFDLHPNLGAAINYTFLSVTSRGSDELKDTHRAEFELNPRFKVGDWLEVSTRNRFELRWQEHHRDVNERTRHRLQLEFPWHGSGAFKSAFVSGEVFYDYDHHRITEYRIVPLGLNFSLTPKVSLGVSYMLQCAESGKGWYNRHNFNTALAISL